MNAKLTIWLVEDDVAQLQLLQALLDRSYPEVTLNAVTDGSKLLTRLHERFVVPHTNRLGRESHIVITDLHLTGMSGLELVAAIKKDPTLSWIPVLFLSGTQSANEILETYHAGGTAYLVKPLDLSKLETMLKNIVDFWSVVHS